MLSPYLSKLNSARIILASSSVGRQRILAQSGLKFISSPSTFAEDLPKSSFTHEEYVKKTAEGKLNDKLEELRKICENGDSAQDFMTTKEPTIVIVGDTVISYQDQIIEKAEDEQHAAEILRLLSGGTHDCISSVFISFLDKDMNVIAQKDIFEKTTIELHDYSDQVIEDFVKTGKAFGISGCYNINTEAATFVKSINGCYYNLGGFPLSSFCLTLIDMLEETGFLEE
ncbi:unnamed protein product [Moneuplotes crassus]|uniref:Maf-like protein n=1 Tax=Euplotes crassus TaxID=5936 RepID=A0AAD2D4P5_EUPCR|nr:unnamed protein product [Moneuplotes crassus]